MSVGILASAQLSAGGGGGAPYTARAVVLNGSTSLSIASLTALGDATGYASVSIWFKAPIGSFGGNAFWAVDPDNAYTSNAYINGGPSHSFFQSQFCNVDDSKCFSCSHAVAGPQVVVDAWNHVLISVQTNLASGQKIYNFYLNDGAPTKTVSDLASAFLLTFNGKKFQLFDDGNGPVTANVADVWFAPGQYIDFSVQANRRKFIDADGKPVDLGADGSTPTGTAPAIFFSGVAAEFATNKGTGGSFTLTGSLTDASTSPSD